MNKMKKTVIAGLLVICFLFTLVAPIEVEAAVKINNKTITLPRYHSYQLKLSGTKKKVKWESKDKLVATVDKQGVVHAENEGQTTIVASVGKKKYQCTVKVVYYDEKRMLAAYGYKALNQMLEKDAGLIINEVRIGSYVTGVNYAYFDCEFKDLSGERKKVYMHIYENELSSVTYCNIRTGYYENYLIMRFNQMSMDGIEMTRSESIPLKEVKKASNVISKIDSLKITKGEEFNSHNGWISL